MAWQTPKVDWSSDDVVANTDMNRWEENHLANRRRFEVSNNFQTGAGIGAGNFQNNQIQYFTLQDDMKLIVKNCRYRFQNSGLRIRVYYDIGGGPVYPFTSASHEGDEEPDQLVLSNTTGSPVSGDIGIQVYNSRSYGCFIHNSSWNSWCRFWCL